MNKIPDVIFDGLAVYQALTDKAKGRTSPENVSDALDAVVTIMRRDQKSKLMGSRDYEIIPTSPEVWAVLKARHWEDLKVFSSFSNPNGTFHGGCGTHGEMFTSYGFKSADYPLMEARTTWEIDREKPHQRINEKHEYWLCLPIKEDEDA